MISSRKNLLLAGLLASAAFVSTGAFAQPLPGTQAPAEQQQRATRGDPSKRFERMQQHRVERLSALKEKLKLTPAQEGAWNNFASAQQPPARPADQRRMERAEIAKLTTPERLDRMQARQAERSAMFAKRADVTRSFYATLTPEQQKTFDAESMPRFGEHGGQHRHPAAPATKS